MLYFVFFFEFIPSLFLYCLLSTEKYFIYYFIIQREFSVMIHLKNTSILFCYGIIKNVYCNQLAIFKMYAIIKKGLLVNGLPETSTESSH